MHSLATNSKVSANQYSKYLRGSFPTIDVAVRTVNYFECTLDYFFGITEYNEYKSNICCNLSLLVKKYEQLLETNQTTYYKFAKQNGLSESCLRHWKYGQIPKIESLIIIATRLNSSVDYLVGRN